MLVEWINECHPLRLTISKLNYDFLCTYINITMIKQHWQAVHSFLTIVLLKGVFGILSVLIQCSNSHLVTVMITIVFSSTLMLACNMAGWLHRIPLNYGNLLDELVTSWRKLMKAKDARSKWLVSITHHQNVVWVSNASGRLAELSG